MGDPNKWGEEQIVEEAPEIRKGVMGMKFMRDAEERQKQLNAQHIVEIKAAVEAGSDDDEMLVTAESISQPVNQGRKTFVPGDEANFYLSLTDFQTEQPKRVEGTNDEQEDKAIDEELVLRIVKNPFHMNEVSPTD